MQTQSILEEQLKKSEHMAIGWPWRILVFMIIIFILIIIAYAGMMFGYKPYLNSQIKNLDQKIANLSQSVNESQQEEIIKFYSQFINIKNLLDSRQSVADFLGFIENKTYPNTVYRNLSLNVAEREVKIDGSAPNYDTLIKELTLIEKSAEVEKIFLDNSSLSELGKGLKELKFNIKIIFKKDFFKL